MFVCLLPVTGGKKKRLPMTQYPKIPSLLFFVFFSLSVAAQKPVKKYIKKYERLALQKTERYGIPASIILGVSIEESAAGQSQICKALNNFFGIKGKNSSSLKKMGYQSAYKEYASDAESFEHFCIVMAKKKFYAKLKGSTDFKLWLKEMNIASYSTSKQKWIDHITTTIDKYKLYKLDKGKQETVALNN
jgi:flagellum-specific peptidoglycan hydrolase FlgJ